MMLTREQFVKIAARCLERNRSAAPAQQAELLAQEIERTVELLRDLAAAPPSPQTDQQQEDQQSPWPAPNPASVSVSKEPEPAILLPAGEQAAEAETEAKESILAPDDAQESESVSRLPESPVIRRSEAESLIKKHRSGAKSSAHPSLTVEELNLLVQERTPPMISVQVQLPGGETKVNVTMNRNVLSAHAEGCVKLVYYHPKAPRDLYVEEVISIEDIPVDLAAVLERLKKHAEIVLKPSDGPIRSFAPQFPDGPVIGGEVGVSSADLANVRAIWESLK